MRGPARFAFFMLAFGYAFLYLPIALVMIYSFNESRLVTVWAGFSTRWWSALLANDTMLRAAWLSLRIALVSAMLSRTEESIPVTEKTPPAATKPIANAFTSIGDL